jgi:diguanylate cyclase (GGDEF)-like protein
MGTTSDSIKGIVTPKILLAGIAAVVVLLLAVLATTIYFTLNSNAETEEILSDSVRAELIASCIGAREILTDNIGLFEAINSQEDVEEHWDEWLAVVQELRLLNTEIGGEYIYALKELDGEYYFVFDTDLEAQRTHDNFTPYELSPVHEEAFGGTASAGLANVVDEWGSFNTGALPLYDEKGHQIGIVSVDIQDTFIARNRESSNIYTTALIVTTAAVVVLMLIILSMLIRRNSKMQQHLFTLANFDGITKLPNRNNLFTFLAREIDHLKEKGYNFAVFFIDLDNFKTVNDHAGHDTGDELLRQISYFLNGFAQKKGLALVSGMEPLTARIGGDEFLQLMPKISTVEQATEYAQGLLNGFAEEKGLRKFIENFGVGLSIGIALFPSMQTDYDELIKYADIAMYHAKNSGKNNYKVYESSMGNDVEGAELIVRQNKGSR